MKKVDIKNIDEKYLYMEDDLGYTAKEGSHIFKLWSPLSEYVKLCVYDNWDSKNCIEFNMIKEVTGVWQYKLNEEVENKYYTFKLFIKNEWVETVDPYAKAVSVNGERGSILDLKNTNPKGWENEKYIEIKSPVDAIIYEMHVRDFSIDKNSGIKAKGKFIGLTEEDSSFNGKSTGLKHVKELGITHIQLLPIYDFGSIDERKYNVEEEFENREGYNWGYDPHNYNVPEGSYSTDPFNPAVRIEELKKAIMSIHKNGMGVVMDVVYNHMYDVYKSSLHKTMPEYFYRYDKGNKLADETGCGNVIASEHRMVRKYIVDSVKFWAREYKIDAFRFDLMGLIDIKTMKEIRDELKKINPSSFIIGEGWNMGWHLKEKSKTIQKNANRCKEIGFFNDEIRDSLRGSAFDNNDKGFLLGNESKVLGVKRGIVAECDFSNDIKGWGRVEPSNVVNYVECHDNHTLYDKLNLVCNDEKKLQYMHRLGSSIVILSQGIPFIHAGQEFLRTKNGVENSYNANDSINKIEWDRKEKYIENVEYIKGLIKIRKKFSELRLKSACEIRKKVNFIETPKGVIGYLVKLDKEKELLVIYNSTEEEITLDFSEIFEWSVLANKEKASINIISYFKDSKIKIESISTFVAIRDRAN